jgi:uncharacterized protein involved in exopolysaccharide biosynthesis
MSIAQFLRILWARRNVIILSLTVCLAAAVLVGKLLPARFTAHSRIMLDVVKPDPVTGAVMSGQFARAYTATQVELITDYRVAIRAAELLDWTNSPQLISMYRSRSSSDARDFSHWLAQIVIDGTDAKLIEGSNILDISYTTSSPEVAAKVADAIRESYVDQAIALSREDANTNAEWFDKQAAKVRTELTAAEQQKAEFERANGIVLDQDMVDEDSKRLSALAASAQAGPVMPQIAAVNPLAGQLGQIDAQIAEAAKVLGPNNPQLVAMKRQREALAASASAAAPRLAGGGPSLTALYNAQQAKVLADRGKANEARQLAMSVAALRDQYQKTLARSVDLRQQSESNDSGMTLLASASLPQSPSFPRWGLIIPGAIGFGLVLGVMAALLAELSMRRVRGPEDLKALATPLLGMMSVQPTVTSKRRWFRRRRELEPAAA